MSRTSVVVAATSVLLGCGSGGAGSLDGKVGGHEVSVKEAVFVPLGDGEVFVAAADQENLCAILNGQQKPSNEMNLLELVLANWNGSSVQPLVTGSYTLVARNAPVSSAGLYSFAILFWTRECLTFGSLGPTSGNATVESVGLPQAGAHTVLSVDLSFAAEHLSGHLDATYCAEAAVFGTACQPQLRGSPSTTE